MIVVKQGNNILDKSVIKFSEVFYKQVFKGDTTVCESFKTAKHTVEVSFGSEESNKFTILTHTDLLKEKKK